MKRWRERRLSASSASKTSDYQRAGVKSDILRGWSGREHHARGDLIDTETWGTRELLEVISSRFFELGTEGSYPNSWEVRGLDGKDVSKQLEELNSHLDTM